MKKAWKWVLAALALSICALAIYAYTLVRQYLLLADEEPDVTLSPGISDIPYCTFNGTANKLDLYYPTENGTRPAVLVYAHGGSFTSGDKRKGSGIIDIPAMTERGYAVAAINYRLMPENPFPAEIIDAKCAVRFLRAHASEFHLNTDKIGIWGGSAGGHLAAMTGLTNGDPAYEAGEYPEQSSRVEAVAVMFGPTDLTAPLNWFQGWLLRRAFGTDDPSSDLLHRASPIYTVPLMPPAFLILHGELDSAVPVSQAEAFQLELGREGVHSSLVIVKNANHNFKPTGGAIEPTRQEISNRMADFFDEHLK
jgi:acetyl esterase/lipase